MSNEIEGDLFLRKRALPERGAPYDSCEISRVRRSMGQLVEGASVPSPSGLWFQADRLPCVTITQVLSAAASVRLPTLQALAGVEDHGRYINGSGQSP